MGLPATTSRRPALVASLARVLVVASSALAFAGCPGEIDHPEQFRRAPARPMCTLGINVETDIFARRCATAGCHAPGASAQAGLDLGSPDPASRLIGTAASTASSCSGHGPLVQSDDPTAGLIYDKLGAMVPCGSSMPPGGPVLSEAEITCLRAYMFDHSRFNDAGTGTGGDAATPPPADSGSDADATSAPPADAMSSPPEGGTG